MTGRGLCAALVGLALVGAGCGRRLIGRVALDAGGGDAGADNDADTGTTGTPDVAGGERADRGGDSGDTGGGGDAGAPDGGATGGDGGYVGGAIAWTRPGTPVSGDGTANLYAAATEDPGSGYFWRYDWATGLIFWEYKEALNFLCFGDGVAVFAGVGRMASADGSTPIEVRSAADGARRWSAAPAAAGPISCWPALDLFFAVETPVDAGDGAAPGLVLTAYRSSASAQQALWQIPTADGAAIAGADSQIAYVSWYAGAATHLQALRTADGGERWNVSIPTAQSLSFVFAAGAARAAPGDLYGIDSAPGIRSIIRIAAATGARSWTYAPAADGFRLITEGAASFFAVQEGTALVAVDAATGRKIWSYDANPGGQFSRWDAEFMPSGDLLVTGHIDGDATTWHLVIDPAGNLRWSLGPLATPNSTGRYLWAVGAGDLYSTASGKLSRLDPPTGAPVWTFAAEPIDRVIGGDDARVIAAGPPFQCIPCVETVLSFDRNDGRLLWKTPEPLWAGNRLFAADGQRLYLSAPTHAKYQPGTITALWK